MKLLFILSILFSSINEVNSFITPNLLKYHKHVKSINTQIKTQINTQKFTQKTILYNSAKTYDVPVLYEDKPFATFVVRLFNGEKIWFRVNMTEKMGNLRALIDKHYPAPDNQPYELYSGYPSEPIIDMDKTILDADILAKQLAQKAPPTEVYVYPSDL